MSSGSSNSAVPAFYSSTSTCSSLLQRVRTRDADAWQRLVDIYGPQIYRWCRQSHLESQDSADVAQEVFAALVKNIEGFRGDRAEDSFRGWLWTITRNKIRDHLRRCKAEAQARGGTDAALQMALIPAEFSTSSQDAGASVDEYTLGSAALASIRERFEERTWQAFWRTTVGGEPGTDVAADLGLSVQAVYQAKYRVLSLLRGELGDFLG